MNLNPKQIYKLTESIKDGIKDAEHYNTGLVGEALIVSSYKQMTVENLRKMQFIIGKIIKLKVEQQRMNEKKEKSNNDGL
jgi:hypothetical protein